MYNLSGPTVGKLSPPIAFKVFDSQLMPILEYGSEVWFSTREAHTAPMERFHLKFIKSTLNVRTQTATNAIYAETGRLPLQIRHQIQAIKYWIKILELTSDHPVKQAYYNLYNLDASGQRNWCTKIRNLLGELGYINIWNDQKVGNSVAVIKEIWVKMQNSLREKYMQSIQQSDCQSKLRTYKIFKEIFGYELYLSVIKDPRYRTALCRLRLSSHCLAIETGRHVKPKLPVDARLCTKCNTQSIEDEIHFILICPSYTVAREPVINELIKHIPNLLELPAVDQFKCIMQCNEHSFLSILGKFIHDSFRNEQ